MCDAEVSCTGVMHRCAGVGSHFSLTVADRAGANSCPPSPWLQMVKDSEGQEVVLEGGEVGERVLQPGGQGAEEERCTSAAGSWSRQSVRGRSK